MDSLFRFDADSTEEIYGGVQALAPGLQRVVAQLDGSDRDSTQTRMAMNVLHLERRFVAAPEVVEKLRLRLEEVQRERQPWEPTHPAVLSRLGEVYADLISPLGPRVMVPAIRSTWRSRAWSRKCARACSRHCARPCSGASWAAATGILLVSRRRMVRLAAQEAAARGG